MTALLTSLKDRLLAPIGFAAGVLGIVTSGPFVAVLALLPLSALLLMLPALMPDETVVSRERQRSAPLRDLGFRLFALLAGLAALVGLIVAAIEITSWLPLRASMRWPIAILIIYLFDLVLLIGIGKVPLTYNVRNLLVRWPVTLLTALAFTVVVALMTVMMAFVHGMDALTESSGQPDNVMILSDGSIDELFSNLGYNDLSTAEREQARFVNRFNAIGDLIRRDPLETPITVQKTTADGQEKYLFSYETYVVVNQPMPALPGQPVKRRFVQVRGIVDPVISGMVHNIELLPGGNWFSQAGVDEQGRTQAVMGEGVAGVFGEFQGKKRLDVGDTFELGVRTYVVTGIMKSEGSTFGSEVWAKQSLIGEEFRKAAYTTCTLKVAEHPTLTPKQAATVMAGWLRNDFKPKIQALTETEYFSKLTSTNKQFLVAIMIVAAIMAIGGIFGIMNTMFAAISQRTKDIGVLRILGFKRWQVLVSFMLESLTIAFVGGLLGVALGSLADGWTATSILSGGAGGGGKFVVLRMSVGPELILLGIVFTLVMGRLGGLIPALSAMRLGILDSLR